MAKPKQVVVWLEESEYNLLKADRQNMTWREYMLDKYYNFTHNVEAENV